MKMVKMDNLQVSCGYCQERRNSGTNASREENDVSSTKDCLVKKDSSVTNGCRKKTSKEENGGLGTNVCREEKSDAVANDCGEDEDETKVCRSCGSQGSFQKCSRCKEAFYCSKECQSKDWSTHKRSCTKKLTEEEKIKAEYEKMRKENEKFQRIKENGCFIIEEVNFKGTHERMMQMLTLEQALYTAIRPTGSLERSKRLARIFYPLHDIVTDFDNIPWEHSIPFMMFRPPRRGYMLVAFMYRYHEHVMRHGVYLKDAEDKESKVEFYLDDFGDNPFPFFSYSQVKPGGYICLVDPVMHMFMDGTVGIRINNPSEVMVLNIEMVMKET